MGEIKIVVLKVVVETEGGNEEYEIKESDTKYWDAVKKLLEECFTTHGTRVAPPFTHIG